MRDTLLRSVLVAMVLIPILAARDPHPVRGLKKALVWFVAFNLVYAIAVRFLYSRLS